jgi:hypothetical protein
MSSELRIFLVAALLATGIGSTAAQESAAKHPRVLFFSKATSWEQKIVHRDHDDLSYIEKAMLELGRENGIDFTFSKDGTEITLESLAKFDALFFYTSGDLTVEPRNGRGDNYPLMTLEGKKALFEAIENGMGFVGCNTANYTFPERLSPGEKEPEKNAWRYPRMLGAGYMGHNEVQAGRFSYFDHAFPGMEKVPEDYHPVDQWYAFNRFQPDLHVIMALDAGKLTGNLYERQPYPVAWARQQGKGRVFYTTMGHTAEIWKEPHFLQMLLGGIRWAAKVVNADVTPDIATVTPHANEYPVSAGKFVASHPTVVDPHFPNFKVWLDQEYPTHGGKRVLVYTKSSGYEHPIVYRDTAWPSPVESLLLDFGREFHIDFVFTKDGAAFTPENLASFDAILFFTSGDLTDSARHALGDNYPPMPVAGLRALLDAVRQGKGLIAVHSTLETLPAARDAVSPELAEFSALLGGEVKAGAKPQATHLHVVDRDFPGMDAIPSDDAPVEEWTAFHPTASDLHVLLETPDGQPVAWTRLHEKGRVYCTTLGHSEEEWKSEAFRKMLLGAIRWTTGEADGSTAPNVRDLPVPPKENPGR